MEKRDCVIFAYLYVWFCAAGCGSAPADEVDTQLDMPEPIADESGNNEADADSSEDAGNKADASSSENIGNEADTNDSANSENENPPESSGKWHVYEADVAAAIDADFEGCVQNVNTDSFLIFPSTTILEEDGSLSMSVTADGVEVSNEELVQVAFDSDTTFIQRDIYDGGARHEDSNVSFQNIEKGSFVSLKGEFQNDIFHANTVRINKSH